jgi:FkbM family methyltransferase
MLEFARGSVQSQHEILRNLLDVQMIERIRFSFLYPLQVGALTALRSLTGYSPWIKLDLPYGIKCLYNASNGISGSITSIIFRKDCFLLDYYKPRKGDTIVDVGAYVGLYSILSSNLVGNDGSIYAIEPEPQTFSLLIRNLRLNDLNNVLLLNSALSDKTGEAPFYVPKGSTAGSSFHLQHLKAQKIKDYTEIKVKVQTFDNLLASSNLRHVDIMKVDVEGAELSVLHGADNSLAEGSVAKLVIEVHKTVNKLVALRKFLKARGYVIEGCFDLNEYVAMLYARKE